MRFFRWNLAVEGGDFLLVCWSLITAGSHSISCFHAATKKRIVQMVVSWWFTHGTKQRITLNQSKTKRLLHLFKAIWEWNVLITSGYIIIIIIIIITPSISPSINHTHIILGNFFPFAAPQRIHPNCLPPTAAAQPPWPRPLRCNLSKNTQPPAIWDGPPLLFSPMVSAVFHVQNTTEKLKNNLVEAWQRFGFSFN